MSAVLREFERECAAWYGWGDRGRNDCKARVNAYKALMHRHSPEAVGRHQRAIARALTNAELRYARGYARQRLLADLE